MTKRKRGHKEGYESVHPNRPWTPDIPGHRQKGKEPKRGRELREEQIQWLKEELFGEDSEPTSGGPERS